MTQATVFCCISGKRKPAEAWGAVTMLSPCMQPSAMDTFFVKAWLLKDVKQTYVKGYALDILCTVHVNSKCSIMTLTFLTTNRLDVQPKSSGEQVLTVQNS